MLRFNRLVLMAVVVLFAFFVVYAQDTDEGAGAVIEIGSFEELCLIGVDEGYPLDGDYELVADIDASGSRELNGGAGFLPIGRRRVVYQDGNVDVFDTSVAFTGTFDGKGYTVRGLYINRNASSSDLNIGLFGFIYGANISNVRVVVDTIVGYRYVGALVGRQSGGAVEGCFASGMVMGRADVGGLVGAVDGGGTVKASYSAADVGGETVGDAGGLVGSADFAEIIGSYSIGSVTVINGSNVGGLVGSLVNSAKVRSCYSTATVIGGDAGEVGGLVGSNDGEVRQSYAAGAVSSTGDNVGGLIGTQGNGVGLAVFCFWDTERSGCETSAGGSGVTGKTTAQMMDAASVRNLVVADAASWGISNNYPYLKNDAFPRYTITVTAGLGGALSGVTTAAGTVHTQIVNHWIAGSPIAAMPSADSIVGGFDGWYVAGTDTALVDGGQYDGFAVKISDDGKTLLFSDLTADVEIEARFILKKYTLKYVAVNGRGKIVSPDSIGEYTADTLLMMVEHGAVSSVTAVPNVGYKFLEWMEVMTGEKSKDTTRSDIALYDGTFRAFFTIDSMAVTYTADSSFGKLRVVVNNVPRNVLSYNAKLPYGGNGPRVEAVPNENYKFVRWSDGDTSNPRTDSAVVATIEVAAIFEEIPVIAVKSIDRSIPNSRLINETAQIQPAKATAGVFTAGPNPVSRQNGKVDFYWQGTGITGGTLFVFDANGNFVDKIAVGGGININTNNNSGINSIDGINNINGINTKRRIAEWKLKDASEKPVGPGTYLIKGTLSTKNGTSEKVAFLLMLI